MENVIENIMCVTVIWLGLVLLMFIKFMSIFISPLEDFVHRQTGNKAQGVQRRSWVEKWLIMAMAIATSILILILVAIS